MAEPSQHSLSPRPSSVLELCPLTIPDMFALFPYSPSSPPPPAQPLPPSPPSSVAGPSRASSAAASPTWSAAPPAARPSVLVPPLAYDAAPAYVFPDPSLAIAAAVLLPASSLQPHVATLTSGLDSAAARSTFLDVPDARDFADSVCTASEYVPPEKLLTFLVGGNGCMGILADFRRQRTVALLEKNPLRTRNSVSGSAYEDARYFARQIFVRLIENALADVVMSGPDASMRFLSETQQQEICGFRDIVAAGGVREILRRCEEKADADAVAVQAVKLAEKEEQLLALNNGLPLSLTQSKTVRDAASGARCNEKRKKLYDLTRAEAKYMLLKRWELHDAYAQGISAWPEFSSCREFAPVPEA